MTISACNSLRTKTDIHILFLFCDSLGLCFSDSFLTEVEDELYVDDGEDSWKEADVTASMYTSLVVNQEALVSRVSESRDGIASVLMDRPHWATKFK